MPACAEVKIVAPKTSGGRVAPRGLRAARKLATIILAYLSLQYLLRVMAERAAPNPESLSNVVFLKWQRKIGKLLRWLCFKQFRYTWRRWVSLLAVCFCSGPAVSGNALSPLMQDSALLIGVAEYQNGDGRRDLPETTRTIERIAEALRAHHFYVETAINTDTPTFRKKLTNFLNMCKGRCVFYFTGHGIDSGKDDRGVSCLLLSDSTWSAESCLRTDNFVEIDSTEEDVGKPPFALDELAYSLGSASANKLLVVLDACYAGSLTEHFGKTWNRPEPLIQRSGPLQDVLDKAASIAILTSGGHNKVPRGDRFGKALACSLVDAHVDADPEDGTISFSEIRRSVLNIMTDAKSAVPMGTSSPYSITFEKMDRNRVTDLLKKCPPL